MLLNLAQHVLTSHVNSSNPQFIASLLGEDYNKAERNMISCC